MSTTADEEERSSPVQPRKGATSKRQNGKVAADRGKNRKEGKKQAGSDDDFTASSSADEESECRTGPLPLPIWLTLPVITLRRRRLL